MGHYEFFLLDSGLDLLFSCLSLLRDELWHIQVHCQTWLLRLNNLILSSGDLVLVRVVATVLSWILLGGSVVIVSIEIVVVHSVIVLLFTFLTVVVVVDMVLVLLKNLLVVIGVLTVAIVVVTMVLVVIVVIPLIVLVSIVVAIIVAIVLFLITIVATIVIVFRVAIAAIATKNTLSLDHRELSDLLKDIFLIRQVRGAYAF